jgi:hypothetical protein
MSNTLIARPWTDAPISAQPSTALDELLQPILELSFGSPYLRFIPSPPFLRGGEEYSVPHFVFNGPLAGGEFTRLGLFAAIHGDEPEGAHSLLGLIKRLVKEPQLAAGYQLHIYPVCNPSGFAAGTRHAQSGLDLNREFWRRSAEPEVWWLEHELVTRRFNGLISLHGDDSANGFYAYVRGAVFTENLARPALAAATQWLQVDTRPVIDGFRNHDGLLHECFDGVLSIPPADLDPEPFEIILETAQSAPAPTQVQANLAAILAILEAYRGFLGYQSGI